VLIELLNAQDPKVRRIAVQGLRKVGAAAKPAVPVLLKALDDEDGKVRRDAEWALFRIDREAAEAAGVEVTGWGPMRKPR
jgi:HEAT repeat protein